MKTACQANRAKNLELSLGIQYYFGRSDLPAKRIKLIEPHLMVVENQVAPTRSYSRSYPYQTPNCTFWRIYNDRLPVSKIWLNAI